MFYCSLLHEIIYSIAILGVGIIFAKQSGLNHALHFEPSRVMEHVCSCTGTTPKTVIETKYSWVLLCLTVQRFLRILSK